MPYADINERRRVSRDYAARARKARPEVLRAATNAWRIKNPEKVRAYKQKRLQDPTYKLLERYRTRVWWALKRNQKSAATQTLLGCSVEALREHLQAQFRPGMSWENYGPAWHVDHRIPCAKFDLSDPQQQRECFHYTNLQPLFAAENLSKGDRC